MSGPLAGVKVIEIAQEIQGPYAGLFLADMGASVIKVEMPEVGDLSRHMLVRLIAGPEAENADFSHYFLAMNRGKRSITLDLKKPEAKRVLSRLLESADVLLSNYRPGVLERLGFGYEDLLEQNPRLIYAAGSSWGPEGPWRQRPSRDTLAQAELLPRHGDRAGDLRSGVRGCRDPELSWREDRAAARRRVSEQDHRRVVVGARAHDPTCPPPELGQHSEEILLEAGVSWEEIARLRESDAL